MNPYFVPQRITALGLKKLVIQFLSIFLAACVAPQVDTAVSPTIFPTATHTSSPVTINSQTQKPAITTSPPEIATTSDLSTPDCQTHQAQLMLYPSSDLLQVGDSLILTATLSNTGCAMLGLPKYSLTVMADGDGGPVQPTDMEPVIHSIGLRDGEHDEAYITLKAVAPGKAELKVSASFEVHLGYPGPAYWSSATSRPVIVEVGK